MADNNKNENNTIFRKKSLDKFSSVEDLDKYIKTTTPSLWLLLACIIVFLVGVIVWAVVGKINVETVVGCKVTSEKIDCYISEDRIDSINSDSYIVINDMTFVINDVDGPFEANENSDQVLLHTSDIEVGNWFYKASANGQIADGSYKAKIVFEEVSPITFVIN